MKKLIAGCLIVATIFAGMIAIPQNVQATDEKSLGAAITYNNGVMNGFGLEQVIDGNYAEGNGYVSDKNLSETNLSDGSQYFQIKWNEAVDYNSVTLYSTYCGTADTPGQAPTEWKIQTSIDGDVYTDVATVTAEWAEGGHLQSKSVRFTSEENYKFIRIVFLKANLHWEGKYCVTEIDFATEGLYDESGAYKISDYWSETAKKAPTKKDYVFGGWYKKEGNKFVAIKESELSNDVVKNMIAYPKFVPAEVLSVKTQLGQSDTETSLRLLSTIDSTNYKKVGFEYQLGSRAVADKEMSKVYTAIKTSKTSDTLLYPYNEFSPISKYFIALDVNNISSKSFASIIYARPYWITMDGTKVMGLARNNRVEDKTNNYLSVPINLLTDGKIPAALAVGKMEITYNTDNYDVVVVGNNKLDSGKVLPEMAYSVNERTGTIRIVGNAITANENILADGIFANIRFVKASDAKSDDLDFTIETTQFCNWEEQYLGTNNLFVQ